MPLYVSVELPPEHTYLSAKFDKFDLLYSSRGEVDILFEWKTRSNRMKKEKKQSFGPQFKEFMHQSIEKSESYSFHKSS